MYQIERQTDREREKDRERVRYRFKQMVLWLSAIVGNNNNNQLALKETNLRMLVPRYEKMCDNSVANFVIAFGPS